MVITMPRIIPLLVYACGGGIEQVYIWTFVLPVTSRHLELTLITHPGILVRVGELGGRERGGARTVDVHYQLP